MKKEQIMAGQIYCAIFNISGDGYIYEAPPGNLGYKGYLHPKTKSYYIHVDTRHDWTSGYTVRLATTAEISHFKACQCAGHYVKAPEEIINQYEIY